MAPEKSKGGRHGQTRLCVHGVTHVEFTFVHALGRDSPFQALRCAARVNEFETSGHGI